MHACYANAYVCDSIYRHVYIMSTNVRKCIHIGHSAAIIARLLQLLFIDFFPIKQPDMKRKARRLCLSRSQAGVQGIVCLGPGAPLVWPSIHKLLAGHPDRGKGHGALTSFSSVPGVAKRHSSANLVSSGRPKRSFRRPRATESAVPRLTWRHKAAPNAVPGSTWRHKAAQNAVSGPTSRSLAA